MWQSPGGSCTRSRSARPSRATSPRPSGRPSSALSRLATCTRSVLSVSRLARTWVRWSTLDALTLQSTTRSPARSRTRCSSLPRPSSPRAYRAPSVRRAGLGPRADARRPALPQLYVARRSRRHADLEDQSAVPMFWPIEGLLIKTPLNILLGRKVRRRLAPSVFRRCAEAAQPRGLRTRGRAGAALQGREEAVIASSPSRLSSYCIEQACKKCTVSDR